MYYTIYKVTNQLNGKCYVGKHQTQNLDDGYMGSGKLIRRAIAKHGVENFTKEILHVFDNEAEMNAKEAEIVTEDFCKTSYNLCTGGRGGFSYINNYLPEARLANSRKGSEKIKELWATDKQFREKVLAGSRKGSQKLIEWKKANVGSNNKAFILDDVKYESITDYANKHGIHKSAAHQRVNRKCRDIEWIRR